MTFHEPEAGMDDMRSTIGEFTDDELLNAWFRTRDQYTPEAQAIMAEVMRKRNLGEKDLPGGGEPGSEPGAATVRYELGDFVPFEHSFSATDLLLASAVLKDNDIPFFADNPTSSTTFPIETEADRRLTIKVHKDFVEKAHELLGEHFSRDGNRYVLKNEGTRERLRAFNFHDIPVSEHTLLDEIEVSLTADEKAVIVALGRRLLKEADLIEKTQDRILFYYDALEPLIEELGAPESAPLTRSDLLAILEIMQVYVDDEGLPGFMDDSIATLLSFFLEADRAPS
jgi:hypothetical protein